MMSGIGNSGFHGEWIITDKNDNEIGIINFDSKTLKPINGSDEWRLTKYQYNLFKALVDNKGRLLSPEELYDAYKGQQGAHSQDAFVDYKKNLTDAVYNMKKKYPFLKQCIENGKGYGAYFFNGGLHKSEEVRSPPDADEIANVGNVLVTHSPAETAHIAATAVMTDEARQTTEIAGSEVAANHYISNYDNNREVRQKEVPKKKKRHVFVKVLAGIISAAALLLAGFFGARLLGNNTRESGVEQSATKIMFEHDDIVRSILSGDYRNMEVDNGLTAYKDKDALVSMIAEKSYGNSNYSRSFFYSGEDLLFAEYAGDNLHQFYFKDGRLIRWKHAENTPDGIKVTDHDREDSYSYGQWEQWVLGDSAELIKLWEFSELTGSRIKDYMFPDSNSRYLTEADLLGLSREEVRTALNELYARHGRRFYSEKWQSYFNSKSWYTPQVDIDDFSESIFNDYERENRKILTKWETDHGWR